MFKSISMTIVLTAAAIFVTACSSNPYKEFYQDKTEGMDLTKAPSVVLPISDPKIIAGSDPSRDGGDMWENNYILLGFSSFSAANVSQKEAVSHGKKVHADTILLYQRYQGSYSSSVPITTPDVQSTNSSFRGNVGSQSFYGSGTATTYGSRTTYVPIVVHRYDYFASFWIKSQAPLFGVRTTDLSPEMRKQLSTNRGAQVWVVVKGSPAYQGDVLRDDVIVKYGGQDVVDSQQFAKLVPLAAGKNIEIELLRDGKKITKVIKVNERPSTRETASK